jgi:hypothetical protein
MSAPRTPSSPRPSRALALVAAALGFAAACNQLFDIGPGEVAPPDAATADAVVTTPVDVASPDASRVCALPAGGELCGAACPPTDVASPEGAGAPLVALASDRERFFVAARLLYAVAPPAGVTPVAFFGSPSAHRMGAAQGSVFITTNASSGKLGVRRHRDECVDAASLPEAAALDASALVAPEFCNYHEYPELKWARPMGRVVGVEAESAWIRVEHPDLAPQVVEYRVSGMDPTPYKNGGPPGRRVPLPAHGASLAARDDRLVYGYDGGAGVFDLAADAGRPLLGDAGSVLEVAATCAHAYLAESGRVVRAPLDGAAPLSVLSLAPLGPLAGELAIDATHLWFVAGGQLRAVPLTAFDRPEVSTDAVVAIGAVPASAAPAVAVTDDYVAVLGDAVLRLWKKHR